MKKTILLIFLITLLGIAAAPQTPSPTPDPNSEKTRADRLQARLNDFANLARYHDANIKLAPPAKGEDRIVFMGDSITDGWKLDQYFPGEPYVNRGISGQTTPQMLLRFRPDVIDLKPRVVVILAGTNDIAGNTGVMSNEDIQGNIQSMAELAKAHGIKVVLSSITPTAAYHATTGPSQTTTL